MVDFDQYYAEPGPPNGIANRPGIPQVAPNNQLFVPRRPRAALEDSFPQAAATPDGRAAAPAAVVAPPRGSGAPPILQDAKFVKKPASELAQLEEALHRRVFIEDAREQPAPEALLRPAAPMLPGPDRHFGPFPVPADRLQERNRRVEEENRERAARQKAVDDRVQPAHQKPLHLRVQQQRQAFKKAADDQARQDALIKAAADQARQHALKKAVGDREQEHLQAQKKAVDDRVQARLQALDVRRKKVRAADQANIRSNEQAPVAADLARFKVEQDRLSAAIRSVAQRKARSQQAAPSPPQNRHRPAQPKPAQPLPAAPPAPAKRHNSHIARGTNLAQAMHRTLSGPAGAGARAAMDAARAREAAQAAAPTRGGSMNEVIDKETERRRAQRLAQLEDRGIDYDDEDMDEFW